MATSDLHSTLEGHTGPVTCIACAPSCLFAVSGSEDKTLRVWGLTLGHIVSAFKVIYWPINSTANDMYNCVYWRVSRINFPEWLWRDNLITNSTDFVSGTRFWNYSC